MIIEIAKACIAQFSKADRRAFESYGESYAIEWVEWAHRTGMAALKNLTPTQRQRIAADITNLLTL